MSIPTNVAEGPYFDELAIGQTFDWAPAVTLTSGLAASHQAIVGDRLALSIDASLCAEVVGAAPIASPALVWNVAIGQSTLATQHVRANLFYRGLVFRRFPLIGDTLRTCTEVVALRQNKPRQGRRPTGLAALHITTVDQLERPVLDFWRCAMLPLRDSDGRTGHDDDLDRVGTALTGDGPTGDALTGDGLTAAVSGWRLDRLAGRTGGPSFADLWPGTTWEVAGGDVVSSAPELARLTLNIAAVHHDEAAAGGRRLVYGGHTIGIALAQACRAFPSLVTVLGWHGCDHTGPVREADTVRSVITIEGCRPLPGGGGLVDLRSRAATGTGDVLDWRFVALMA